MIIRNLTNHQRNTLTVSAVRYDTGKLMVAGTAVEVESYFQSDIRIKTILRIRGWDIIPFLTIQDCFKGAIIKAVMVNDNSFNKINFNNVHHILPIKKIKYNTEDVMMKNEPERIPV